jgi:hypothetical protein
MSKAFRFPGGIHALTGEDGKESVPLQGDLLSRDQILHWEVGDRAGLTITLSNGKEDYLWP